MNRKCFLHSGNVFTFYRWHFFSFLSFIYLLIIYLSVFHNIKFGASSLYLSKVTYTCFLYHYIWLQRTENDRVCFGRSGIHGWGLFARRNIQEGEMVHVSLCLNVSPDWFFEKAFYLFPKNICWISFYLRTYCLCWSLIERRLTLVCLNQTRTYEFHES